MTEAVIAIDERSAFLDAAKAFALLPVGLVLVVYLACRERWRLDLALTLVGIGSFDLV
jgi:hypothetical protein